MIIVLSVNMYIIYIKYFIHLNSFTVFIDKIKKEGLSTSFYEEVIDLTINSSSKSDFPIIDLGFGN
ncbi:hypothetical protein C2G38_2095983 [Gigaspora rosea]|uniref:Uncharacterized protein n=1 Tax=Gigaspora rosea TaxID=44941 RepID=A0A397V386_9GLOM|nr:hypothetical protein C2G38_2095983 [Gigaspora rosea]